MITDTNSWVGKTLSGRYQVKGRLGEGGMALVFRAYDCNLDTDVVLKVPRPMVMLEPDFAGRFAREIRMLVKLAHPHVLKIQDVGEHEGLPFAVMQFLAGGSLEDRFKTRPDGEKMPLPTAGLGDWLEAVAGALDFIHTQRYVHRDVKPANILFDAHGNAFLSDFGIVKVLSDAPAQEKKTAMTRAGMVLGTGPYMAPEVLLGEQYDGRADQFALAVTVYEVLSGRLPFTGTTPHAIIYQQTMGQIPPLQQVVPNLPRELGQVVEQALQKEPARRFADCTTFARAVLAAVSSAPRKTGPIPTQPSGREGPPVICPACKKSFRLPADATSKGVRCPACRAAITVSHRLPDPLPSSSAADTRASGHALADTRANAPQAGAPAATQDPLRPLKQVPRRVWLGLALALLVGAGVLLLVFVCILLGYLLWPSRAPQGIKANQNNVK